MIGQLMRTIRRLRHGAPIVVVSGLPRSGTSMAMKMLEAGGVETFVDGVRVADPDNPKGYFEFERVKELADEEDSSWVAAARGKAIKVISFLLPHLPEDNNYRVILMRRHLDEVIASQNKMLTRRGEGLADDDGRTRELLETQLWRAGYFLKRARHMEWIAVDYSDVLADPRSQAARIRDFVGRPGMDADKMASVVDDNLYRNRAAESNGEEASAAS